MRPPSATLALTGAVVLCVLIPVGAAQNPPPVEAGPDHGAGQDRPLTAFLPDENGFTFTGTAVALSALRTNDIADFAYAPGGKVLAAVGSVKGLPGYLRLWDGAGKELALIREPVALLAVAFSSDGKHLVTGHSDGTVILRDPTSGKPVRTVGRHCSAVRSVAFSPDGATLATGGEDTTVRLWEVSTWKERATLFPDGGAVGELTFTRDGATLITLTADTLARLWSVKTCRQTGTLGDKSPVVGMRNVAVSPDGKSLATVGALQGITLRSVESGKQVAHLTISTGQPQPADPDDPDGLAFPGQYSSDNYTALAFSPDGKTIAAVNSEGEVALWDVAAKRRTRVLNPRPLDIYGDVVAYTTGGMVPAVGGRREVTLSYSPDGKRLALTDGGSVKIFDPAAKKQVETLAAVPADDSPSKSGVRALAYASEGKELVVALDDRSVSVRDRATGAERLRLRGHDDTITCLAVARDGRTLVTGSADHTVKLWDLSDGKELRTLRGHAKWVYAVAISDDGKRVATGGYDRQVKLWDAASGKEVTGLDGHRAAVRALAFSPDGKLLASGGMDRTVKLWNIADRQAVANVTAKQAGVRALAFVRGGKVLVSAGENGVATAWDVSNAAKPLATAKQHTEINTVAVAPGGDSVALGGTNGPLSLWRPGKGDARPIASVTWPQVEVTAAAFAPDGRQLATGGTDGTVLLHYASPVPLRLIAGHKAPLVFAGLSPDGKHVLTASGDPKFDNSLRLWDRATGKEIRRFEVGYPITAAAFSPDGRRCLSGHAGGEVRLWDVATGKPLRTFAGDKQPVRCVAFSPTGPWVAAAGGKSVRLWDADTGKPGGVHAVPAEARSAAFSPDGNELLLTGGGKWFAVPVTKGKVREIPAGEPVQSATWADGRFLLCAAGHKVNMHEAGSGKLLRTMAGHGGLVEQAVLTNDGRTIISVGQDLSVILWAPGSGAELARLEGAFAPPTGVPSGPGTPPGMKDSPPGMPSKPASDGKAEATPTVKEEGQPTPPPQFPPAQPDVGGPPKMPGGEPVQASRPFLSVSADGRYLLTAGGPAGAVVKLWDLRIVRDTVRPPAVLPPAIVTQPGMPGPPPVGKPDSEQ